MPVRIEKHAMTARQGKAARFSMDLVPTDEASFLAKAAAPPPRAKGPGPRRTIFKPRHLRPANAKPIIVIDPGHGGVDPGALSGGVREKDVVLAVADQLRRALEATGRYDVHMTRTTDVFVSLDRRLAISREKSASLFVSIHADSVGEADIAAAVRGAAVYMLSEAGLESAGAAPGGKGELRRRAGRRRDRRRGGDRGQFHPEGPDAAGDGEFLRRFPRAASCPI